MTRSMQGYGSAADDYLSTPDHQVPQQGPSANGSMTPVPETTTPLMPNTSNAEQMMPPPMEDPGFLDHIVSGLSIMRDSPAARQAMPFDIFGAADHVADFGAAIADGGAESTPEAIAMGAVDYGSMGTFDAIAAAAMTLRDNPQSAEEFSAAYANNQDEVNAGLHYTREQRPVATGVGNILGALAPGAVGAKATQGLLNFSNAAARYAQNFLVRNLTVALPAGAEAALYRYNSDGTRQEIIRDGTYGAIGGAIFSAGANVIAGGIRRLTGRNTRVYEELIGARLHRAFENAGPRLARETGDASPQALLRSIQERGLEDTIMDIYPEMRPLITAALNSDADDARRMILDLLEARNATAIDFNTAVMDAVNVPRIRNVDEFRQFTRARQGRLGPRYDAVLDGLDQIRWRAHEDDILTGLRNLGDDTGLSGRDYFEDAISNVTGRMSRVAEDGQISARNLHNIVGDLGDEIDALADNAPGGGLRRVRRYLQQMLVDADDEYAGLTRTYARSAADLRQFERGYHMFRQTASDRDAFINGMRHLDTYSETTSFVQGVRRGLFERMNGFTRPTQVRNFLQENRRVIDNLKAVLGDAEVDALIDDAMSRVRIEETGRGLERSLQPGGLRADQSPSPMQDLALLTRTGDDGLLPSSAPGIKAGFRLAGAGAGTPAQNRAVGDIIARTGTSPARDMPSVFNMLEELRRGNTGQGRRIAARAPYTASVGSAIGGPITSDASGAIEDALGLQLPGQEDYRQSPNSMMDFLDAAQRYTRE